MSRKDASAMMRGLKSHRFLRIVVDEAHRLSFHKKAAVRCGPVLGSAIVVLSVGSGCPIELTAASNVVSHE